MSPSVFSDNQQITDIVSSSIEKFGVTPQAVSACRGLFPVAARVEMLRQSGKDPYAIEPVSVLTNKPQCSFINSQWFFNAGSVSKIKQDFLDSSSLVLGLGTPSLHESDKSNRYLVDVNSNGGSGVFHRHVESLNDDSFEQEFDLVSLDPPWYKDAYLNWLWIADRYLKIGGSLIFPLFGECTKPNGILLRNDICEFTRSLGYDLEVRRDFVSYSNPSFEEAMLRRQGIVHPDWKRADLVVAKKNRVVDLERPSSQSATSRLVSRFQISGVLFECMHNSIQFGQALLIPPEDGAQMKTPSAREFGNRHCNVFTSNGFRFHSGREFELLALLRCVHELNEIQSNEIIELLAPVIDDFEQWFS